MNKPKERPILFSVEMVRAILEGRKTMTRRVIKPQPTDFVMLEDNKLWNAIKMRGTAQPKPCKYGQPGDRLWVRETWIPDPPQDETWDFCLYTDGKIHNLGVIPKRFRNKDYAIYKSTWDGPQLNWISPIYMPRWASRITLEIVGVKIEQLQDISREDCLAEGMPQYTFSMGAISDNPPDFRWKFIELWDSINAKRGYSWESNPWVWAIEFKKVEG